MKNNLTNKILLGLTVGLTTTSPLLVLAQQENAMLEASAKTNNGENDGRDDFEDTSPIKPNLANFPQVNFKIGDNISEVTRIGEEYGNKIINFKDGIYKIIDEDIFKISGLGHLKDTRKIKFLRYISSEDVSFDIYNANDIKLIDGVDYINDTIEKTITFKDGKEILDTDGFYFILKKPKYLTSKLLVIYSNEKNKVTYTKTYLDNTKGALDKDKKTNGYQVFSPLIYSASGSTTILEPANTSLVLKLYFLDGTVGRVSVPFVVSDQIPVNVTYYDSDKKTILKTETKTVTYDRYLGNFLAYPGRKIMNITPHTATKKNEEVKVVLAPIEEYEPQWSIPVLRIGDTTDEASYIINLPEGAKATVLQKIDTSSYGRKPFKLRITFKDNTTKDYEYLADVLNKEGGPSTELLEQKILKLEEELAKLKKDLEKAKQEGNPEKIAKLEAQIEKLKKELGEAKSNIENLNITIKDLNSKIELANKENTKLTNQIKSLKTQITNKDAEISKLNEKIEALIASDGDTSALIEDFQKQIENLKLEKQNLSNEISKKDAEIAKQKQNIENFQKEIENLRNNNSSDNKTINDLKNKLKDANNKLLEAQEIIDKLKIEKNNEIENLKKEIEDLKKKLEKARENADESVKKELENTKKILEEKENEIKVKGEELVNKNKEIEKQEEKIKELEIKLQEEKEKESPDKAKIDELNNALADEKQKAEELRIEKNTLQKDVNNLQDKNKTLEKELEAHSKDSVKIFDLEKKILEKDTEIRYIEKKYNEEKENVQYLKSELEKEKEKSAPDKKRIEELENSLISANERLRLSEEKIASISSDLAKAKSELEKYKKENKDEDNGIEYTQKDIERIRDDLDDALADIEKVFKNIKDRLTRKERNDIEDLLDKAEKLFKNKDAKYLEIRKMIAKIDDALTIYAREDERHSRRKNDNTETPTTKDLNKNIINSMDIFEMLNKNVDTSERTIFAVGSKKYVKEKDFVQTSGVMDAAPYIKNNKVMFPLRFAAEAVGAIVNWNGATRTASFVKNGLKADIQIDSNKIKLSTGEIITMDTKPDVIKGRTFISLSNIAKVFGMNSGNVNDGMKNDIEWNGVARTITIKRN